MTTEPLSLRGFRPEQRGAQPLRLTEVRRHKRRVTVPLNLTEIRREQRRVTEPLNLIDIRRDQRRVAALLNASRQLDHIVVPVSILLIYRK